MEVLRSIEWYREVTDDQAGWAGPNGRGEKYLELFLAFPWLKNIYTKWELQHDTYPMFYTMSHVWSPVLPVLASILYVAGIFGIQKLMANRQKFDLRMPLAYWNLALAVFSMAGMIRTVPHFFWLLNNRGFHEVACGAPGYLYGSGAVGFWVQAFILSKLFELIDTLFIVLRKRQLNFLHWYHHLTVLLFTWFCYVNENPGIIFIAMNYTVHSIMYFYYYLTAVRAWPKWLNPQFITVMQISQMVVGVSCAVYYVMVHKNGQQCEMSKEMLTACAIMYSTYLYLFAEFFVRRFILGQKVKGE